MSGRRRRRAAPALPEVIRLGVPRHDWRDAYHTLLTTTWPRLLGLFVFAYAALNTLFALAYLAAGNAIENARAGSFADAFFFSVQTLATIGYGYMYPKGLATNLLVAAESLTGVVVFALFTGLAFARFSRPTARVSFSRVAVITRYDGVPTLMLRTANERGNQILEAQARLTLLREERSAEGLSMRRLHDLVLEREQTPVFAYTWTLMHRIGPDSPLHGATAQSLQDADALIIVTLSGLDETLSQTVHARTAYQPADLRWGQRFRDVTGRDAAGRRVSDYRLLDAVEPEGGGG